MALPLHNLDTAITTYPRFRAQICIALKLYIREWRDYRNLKQEELEFKSGVSRQTISKAERTGILSKDSKTALSKALNCKPEDLYSMPPVGFHPAQPEELSKEEWLKQLGEGFEAFAADGSLTMDEVIDRLWRVKQGLKEKEEKK